MVINNETGTVPRASRYKCKHETDATHGGIFSLFKGLYQNQPCGSQVNLSVQRRLRLSLEEWEAYEELTRNSSLN